MPKKFLALLVAGALPAAASPIVTIYSGGWAHVVETRPVVLGPEGVLAIEGLPATTLVDSVRIPGLPVTRIVPVLRGAPALADLVGSPVAVYAHGERHDGTLVAVAPVLVLATARGLVFFPSYDRLVAPLPEGPAGLSLRVSYRGGTPGPALLPVGYLAQGFSWAVSYAAALGEGELSLGGLVTITNATGVDYPAAEVALVAGEVYLPAAKAMGLGARAVPLAADAFDVSPAFEYHRYALPGPVDLTAGTVLYPFLSGTASYARAYRFSGGPVEVRVRWTNALAPLPAGEVRFYEGDLFLGAAQVSHTPVGGNVDLPLGVAFDLTGERVLESRERLGEGYFRDTYRISLRSAKEAPVEVEAVESLPGTWTITRSTLPYEVLDAGRVLFRVPVPAGGETVVRYTVEWRY